MKKIFPILIILSGLYLIHFQSHSQEFTYADSWGGHGITLMSEASNQLTINHSLQEFYFADVDLNGQIHKAVHTNGVFLPNDEGRPDLPGTSRYIAIPQGATVRVKMLASRTELINDAEIAPAPRIPLDIDGEPLHYEKDPGIYSVDAFYPESPVTVSQPTQIRGVDVVMLGISPFQYNPVTKELLVHRDMQFEVIIEGGNGLVGDPRLRSRWWDPIVKGSVLNPEALPEMPAKSTPSANRTPDFEYIIITPNNADFIAWANTIKDWRVKQGIHTGVVTTTDVGGNTITAIKNYVNNAYNTWDVPPVAVLLLGDYSTGTDGIISYMYTHPAGYPDFASDNYFADVTGDNLPDVIFARITARNASELQVMVSKFMDYESNPPTSYDFYDRPITALGWQTVRWFQICSETIGGYFKNVHGKNPVRINEVYIGNPSVDPWSTATNTTTVLNYFGPNGLGYIPATPQELGGFSGGTATDIINAINSGSFLLQHRDHGMYSGWGEPYFITSYIDNLTNTGNQLPFIMSINCQTGAFHRSTECFTERFHRYTYNGQNSGAVGLIAATEVSYSFVNDTYVWGVFDNMFPDYMPNYSTQFPTDFAMPAFGNAAGKYFLYQSNWPYNTSDKLITYRLFHHHGDAFQVLYSEVPQNLAVSHASTLASGETTFDVTADAGATIALTVNGAILAVETGTGSALGITIPPQTAGQTMIVTVTKQNYFRYESSVAVVAGSGVYADFSGEPTTVCAGEGVTFTNASSGDIITYTWDFTGGSPSSHSGPTPPVIYYNSPGTYTVELTVSDGTYSDTETRTGYITVNGLAASFSGEPTTLVYGNSVTFTDLSTCNPSNWTWFFEGGNPANYSGQTPPPIYYATPGSYDVTLQISNAYGTDQVIMAEYITVTDIVYCSSSGNTSQEWISSIDIQGQVNSSGGDPSGYADFTGILFNLDPGSSYSVAASPGFSKAPKFEYWRIWIDFNQDGDFTDSGETVFAADKSRTTVYGTIAIPAGVSGSTRMRVSMRRDGVPSPCDIFSAGEVEDYTVSFSPAPPPLPVANFSGNPATLFEGGSVQFTDLSTGNPTSYSWSFPGGTPATSTAQNPQVTYAIQGSYDVSLTVTNESGSDSETKTGYITVNVYVPPDPPVADFSASSTSIFTGQSVDFTDLSANDPTSFSWTFGGGTPATSAQQNPTVTYNTAGTYDVSLTVSNISGSDTETKTAYITVTDAPPASYCVPVAINNSSDWINTVTIGGNTHNSGQGATGYTYYQSPVFSLSPNGTYTVALTPYNGSNRNFWRLWIDFNGDGDFDDSDETLFAANNKKGQVSGSISIPSYVTGVTRMRITMKTGNSPSSCDDGFPGEVEDYNVDLGGDLAKLVSSESKLTVSLYPNPATEQLNVSISGNQGPVMLSVYSFQGQVIRSYEINGTHGKLAVTDLPAGMYFIHVTDGVNKTLDKVIVK